ncbi:riboflavin synthase [Hazenella sp. IB182357]|uniref:Riboflavin synthase n=1 Tax=Polycladospora coralii TaxID=2771432 RepID=A0A926NB71_9BACL|nr:riboflavin synthase [Polycladospora coralii]MBD1372957.1 riboflavin synthase [Polycladospora coralii]
MFTGLIEEVGSVKEIVAQGNTMKLTIACEAVIEDTKLGDSIAVNGVCLTVTQMGENYFVADAMPETMERSNLRDFKHRTPVNLERALAAGQRMGGHYVQGHVDGVAVLMNVEPIENAVVYRFRAPAGLTDYMVEKGSIAINGVSLTLVEVEAELFSVSVIPHTLAETNLKDTHPGDYVNIECDMTGKYIVKWLEKHMAKESHIPNLAKATAQIRRETDV